MECTWQFEDPASFPSLIHQFSKKLLACQSRTSGNSPAHLSLFPSPIRPPVPKRCWTATAQEYIIKWIPIWGRACEARRCSEERQSGPGKHGLDAGIAPQGSPPRSIGWIGVGNWPVFSDYPLLHHGTQWPALHS